MDSKHHILDEIIKTVDKDGSHEISLKVVVTGVLLIFDL